jgi:hypothetical protein
MILLSKKEWTINVYYIDESQNNYAEWKKPGEKWVHTVLFHIYKISGNTNYFQLSQEWEGKANGREALRYC